MLAFNTWSFQKEKALGQLAPIWREKKNNRGKKPVKRNSYILIILST